MFPKVDPRDERGGPQGPRSSIAPARVIFRETAEPAAGPSSFPVPSWRTIPLSTICLSVATPPGSILDFCLEVQEVPTVDVGWWG